MILFGGNEFLSSDELSVVSGAPVGSGMAAVAVYDFGDIEDFCRSNISYVDKLFTELLGEERINRLTSMADSSGSRPVLGCPGTYHIGGYQPSSQGGPLRLSCGRLCDPCGPGLYFFLKQREMSGHYHMAVALLSLCCTGMVLLMGTVTRFDGPFFTYASILDAGEDGMSETTFVNMRSPYNKPYSARFNPSYSLYPLTGSGFQMGVSYPQFTGDEKADIRIQYGEDATRLSVGNVGAFNSKIFRLERWEENREKKGFTGNIRSLAARLRAR